DPDAGRDHEPARPVGLRPVGARRTGPRDHEAREGREPREDRRPPRYSHSIVPGGLLVMSYTTRLIPRTSLMTRDEIRGSSSYGSCTQSAVMPSREWTARSASASS